VLRVKVSSDKQTLILAGEPIPPRRDSVGRADVGDAPMGAPPQRLAMLVVLGDYVTYTAAAHERVLLPAAGAAHEPAMPTQSLVAYSSYSRVLSAGAAEYARTQNLSADGTRNRLIDTYA
jgi:hypothetical protein